MATLPKDPRKSLPVLQARVNAARDKTGAAEARRDDALRAAARGNPRLSIRDLSMLTGLSTARVQQILTPDKADVRAARARKRRKAA